MLLASMLLYFVAPYTGFMFLVAAGAVGYLILGFWLSAKQRRALLAAWLALPLLMGISGTFDWLRNPKPEELWYMRQWEKFDEKAAFQDGHACCGFHFWWDDFAPSQFCPDANTARDQRPCREFVDTVPYLQKLLHADVFQVAFGVVLLSYSALGAYRVYELYHPPQFHLLPATVTMKQHY